MFRGIRGRSVALFTVVVLAGCHATSTPNPTGTVSTPSVSAAPMLNEPGALFYAKAGSLYVSDPGGSPGRKLTEGPFDTQPAPSPDRSHVAFVRKANADDYGGDLWVLDLTPQIAPAGPPRRLVNPAALVHGSGGMPPMVAVPRWSPNGDQVAFVDNPTGGAVAGGVLLVAATDTGVLAPRPRQPAETAWVPFAAPDFAWAPDGRHIAWMNQRSDVRPTDVNVLTVGGDSSPLVAGTNAFSVAYAKDGQTILFGNSSVTADFSPSARFEVRTGGVYSVPAVSVGGKPPAATLLLNRDNSSFSDVAALDSGALSFTTEGAQDGSKVIQVLDSGSSLPRTIVTDVAMPEQGPEWGRGDFVAYLNASDETALVVTDVDNRNPRQVDTGVDSFAWAR